MGTLLTLLYYRISLVVLCVDFHSYPSVCQSPTRFYPTLSPYSSIARLALSIRPHTLTFSNSRAITPRISRVSLPTHFPPFQQSHSRTPPLALTHTKPPRHTSSYPALEYIHCATLSIPSFPRHIPSCLLFVTSYTLPVSARYTLVLYSLMPFCLSCSIPALHSCRRA